MNRFKETYPQRKQREKEEFVKAYKDMPDDYVTLDELLHHGKAHEHVTIHDYDPSLVVQLTKHQSLFDILTEAKTIREAKQRSKYEEWMHMDYSSVWTDDMMERWRKHMKDFVAHGSHSVRGIGKSRYLMGSFGMTSPLNLLWPENQVIHAFDTKGEYHEMPYDTKAIPSGWYFLYNHTWYYRIVHRIMVSVSQVPKAYRLYLRVCHIDQPGE